MIKIKIKEIQSIDGFISYKGSEVLIIEDVISFNSKNKNDNVLMWISQKNIEQLFELNHGTIITPQIPLNPSESVNYIVSNNSRLFFTKLLLKYFVDKEEFKISSSARISSTAIIGENVSIGENVVVEDNVLIGNNSIIGHNTVIKRQTHIGNNVLIGSNNTLGGVGFGYEKDYKGEYIQVPHIGNVVIEDNVEIGNNTCIDRAVLGSTILKNNCKIDNLVHIAHGVIIGENSLVIANAMIAGSSTIGKNVWVAPSANVLNKITISDNTTIGMGAIVLKTVTEEGDILVGNPAISIKK